MALVAMIARRLTNCPDAVEEDSDDVSTDRTGLAFGLVVGAGLSTAIGAMGVYFKSMVTLASKPVLAAGLGFSGGVMLYVSFVEIFVKSTGAFVEDGRTPEDAYYLATACLFGGMLLLRLIALLVHKLDASHHCCDEVPQNPEVRSGLGVPGSPQDGGALSVDDVPVEQKNDPVEDSTRDAKLQRMGVNTAVAIGLHNFPEGLATFVATLADPTVGVTLAIAIAIHNIPEGLCVALPIYYATGSRFKGFMWALFSGLSEPIGAFIGWAIVKSTGEDMNQLVYGILFGIVAGMMIMIVLLELLPTGAC